MKKVYIALLLKLLIVINPTMYIHAQNRNFNYQEYYGVYPSIGYYSEMIIEDEYLEALEYNNEIWIAKYINEVTDRAEKQNYPEDYIGHDLFILEDRFMQDYSYVYISPPESYFEYVRLNTIQDNLFSLAIPGTTFSSILKVNIYLYIVPEENKIYYVSIERFQDVRNETTIHVYDMNKKEAIAEEVKSDIDIILSDQYSREEYDTILNGSYDWSGMKHVFNGIIETYEEFDNGESEAIVYRDGDKTQKYHAVFLNSPESPFLKGEKVWVYGTLDEMNMIDERLPEYLTIIVDKLYLLEGKLPEGFY